MRRETPLRKNPPADLLERIDAYCAEHGMTHSKFMNHANVSKQLMISLRDNKQFHPNTLARLEEYLSGKHVERAPVTRPEPLPTYRRHPCARCGVRGDIGCEHQSANEGRSMYA